MFIKFGEERGEKKVDMLLVLFVIIIVGGLVVHVIRNDWSGGRVAGVESEVFGSALG